MNTKRSVAGIKWWLAVVTMAFLLAGLTVNLQARDRGVNQPGAVGNHGPAGPGVGGSARQTRVGRGR